MAQHSSSSSSFGAINANEMRTEQGKPSQLCSAIRVKTRPVSFDSAEPCPAARQARAQPTRGARVTMLSSVLYHTLTRSCLMSIVTIEPFR